MMKTTLPPDLPALPKRIGLILSLTICATLPLPALATYQCLQNGQTSYQDKPCPPGATERKLPDPPPVSATEMARAKQNAALQKAQLAKLEAAQAKQAQLDAKQANQAAKQRASSERKCKALALQVKWARQDASSTGNRTVYSIASASHGKGQSKALTKAHRSEEKYQALCGAN